MRQLFGRRPAPEFAAWLEQMGIYRDGRLAAEDESVRRRLVSGIDSALGQTA
jgi:ethanolamine ammonia-lyase large subunit